MLTTASRSRLHVRSKLMNITFFRSWKMSGPGTERHGSIRCLLLSTIVTSEEVHQDRAIYITISPSPPSSPFRSLLPSSSLPRHHLHLHPELTTKQNVNPEATAVRAASRVALLVRCRWLRLCLGEFCSEKLMGFERDRRIGFIKKGRKEGEDNNRKETKIGFDDGII